MNEKEQNLTLESELADKILQNPVLLQKLSHKVYLLILDDLRNKRISFGYRG